MTADTARAAKLLKDGEFTCVLCRSDEVLSSRERGIKPLLDFLAQSGDFHGFSAADRIVGRAAAFLYVLLGVKEVYACVMSVSAAEILRKNGIKPYFQVSAEQIINRKGTGICPMEEAVADISEPAAALSAIKAKLEK